MSETMAPKRPGVLSFVGILLYIKAVIALVVGIALLVEKDNIALQDVSGRGSDFLTSTAIGELIVALLLFLVASSIMSGAKWARFAVALVVGIRLALLTYWMIAHVGGGIHWNALLSAAFAIFVLWVLYGNEESQQYFEGYA
jgi:hypothetical protein